MLKFIALKVSNLKLDDIAGLTSETVTIATPQISILGTVGTVKLQALTAASSSFVAALHRQRASELTELIEEKDRQRDALFAEIKRTAKTGQQSSLPAIAAAGNKMVEFLHPFWETGSERMMSQTTQIQLIETRYNADASLAAAAMTLGITVQTQTFFSTNAELLALYNERLNIMSEIVETPAASSLRKEVVASYSEFCSAVEITLSATPAEALQLLFNEMNDIRRKYISRLPVPLDEKHTSVAPIENQEYTGEHITPLPKVFYQTDKELRELVFAQDFTVTYRNNVDVGEAKLLIHGKGKYSKQYTTSFHIIHE
jgi:predicted DNA-binding protein YlxM (UPF0122 family)